MRRLACALFALAAALPAAAESVRIPLQKLTAAKSMELRCVSDEKRVDLAVPARWEVKRLVLHLRYTVSTNLLPDSSQLVVKVRGTPIAQARLNPIAPEVKLGVEIPVDLLEPGYNALSFQVAQHHSKNQCESPCAPDLWTNVSLKESFLEMDYEWRPVPRDLSKLSEYVFDPRLLGGGEVHLVTEELTDKSATLAGIVASGIARRFDYRPVTFTVSRKLVPGKDNVVVGRRAFAEKLLEKHGALLDRLQGGYLRVLPLVTEKRAEPERALLIISGEDERAVEQAALTFSNISFPFPGTDELKAFAFAMPAVEQYSGRETIATDQVYPFKTLNFPTTSFVGINPGTRSITFRLPPDFHIRPNQYAKLALNFSYGAGMKNDSSFAVSVNGRGVRAVPLDSASGNFFDGYKIDIPTYVFQAGTNTIGFTGHLHAGGQVCDLIQPDGLFLTLYENSTITFPPMPHFVELPKLELFMHSGFPLTRWPDGHEAYFWLTEKNDDVLAAALNLIGLATQRNGFPLFGVQFTYQKPAQEGEIVVVGRPQTLPQEIREAAPLKIRENDAIVPYPVVRGWNEEPQAAVSRQRSELGPGRGLLMQFQSPYHSGRTVMLLTAAKPEDILSVSTAILDSAVQAQSRGDLVHIEPAEPEPRVTAMTAGTRYATGKKGSYNPVESFLYTQPYAYYIVSGVAALLLAIFIFMILRRWRAARRAAKEAAAKA
jgi:hypothetical protein